MALGADPDGRGGPHVLVPDVQQPRLDDDARHHLERVLRLAPDDRLTVGDGQGRWRACRFGDEPVPVGEVVEVAEPSPRVRIGFALIKGQRPELVVQKLTEIGVDEIIPIVAERSVVRWTPDKALRNTQRLNRVAREATMQCRRSWLPVVEEPVSFTELAGRSGIAHLAEPGGPALRNAFTVYVGPEGGWSDSERALIDGRVGLGPHVLRAETAAIAAGVLAVAARYGVSSDLG